jgi:hypothetical protein
MRRRYGLVHSSQVSNHLGWTKEDTDEQKVADLRGCVALDDPVWVKVGPARLPSCLVSTGQPAGQPHGLNTGCHNISRNNQPGG